MLKSDVLGFLQEFHVNDTLPNTFTYSFLNLIPKNKNAIGLEEYRPICLVGSLYKILSKILASRLKKVLSSIISLNQSALNPRRQMVDGVMVANELIDEAFKSKKSCMFLKVDFKKAYDRVSWNFLRFMLNFGVNWCRWMEACVFSSHISVLVN